MMISIAIVLSFACQVSAPEGGAGLFSKSLWFIQSFGEVACSTVRGDSRNKAILYKALNGDRSLSFEELSGLMNREAFDKFANAQGLITEQRMEAALREAEPKLRTNLYPSLKRHADLLTTSFDMIDKDHLDAMDQLADWIVENWKPDETLHIVATCTGNSRRSVLSACLGNLAASYYGFDNIRFHSGGTAPTAVNKRTIATLREIGFEVHSIEGEGTRGDPKVPNPKYEIFWGQDQSAVEFSKRYDDLANPSSGFAAILVCSEADAECPTVPGASTRIAMTFIDPKLYDDGAFEAAKYAERRDDIARTMLATLANVRRRLRP